MLAFPPASVSISLSLFSLFLVFFRPLSPLSGMFLHVEFPSISVLSPASSSVHPNSNWVGESGGLLSSSHSFLHIWDSSYSSIKAAIRSPALVISANPKLSCKNKLLSHHCQLSLFRDQNPNDAFHTPFIATGCITDKPWAGKMKPACPTHFQAF